MKKNFTLVAAFLLFLFSRHAAKAQVDALSHTGGLGQWCGWNALTGFDFDIRHDGARNINFSTLTVPRMTIRKINTQPLLAN